MTSYVRKLVSKKKRRFSEDGFDLDLSYITPRIIAMGYPASSFESLYRNPKSEVRRFLEVRHKDKYKVWNLCAEKAYDAALFSNRVERMPFYDHQAPPIDIMRSFCMSVDEWLKQDPENVAVVHCKAGKGRTGVMISCYMVFSGSYPEPAESLRVYAVARTYNSKGVTIPSQIRYVHYFHRSLQEGWVEVPRIQRVLYRIQLTPSFASGKGLTFVIQTPQFEEMYNYETSHEPVRTGDDVVTLNLDDNNGAGLPFAGDALFVFNDKQTFKTKKIFHCWVNTAFVDNNMLVFDVDSLDGPDRKSVV